MLIFDYPTKGNFHAFSMEMFYMYCTVHVCLAECNTPALAIGGVGWLTFQQTGPGRNSFSVPVLALWKLIACLVLVMINYQDQQVWFLHSSSHPQTKCSSTDHASHPQTRQLISYPDHAAALLTSCMNMHLKTRTGPYPPLVVTIMYHGNGFHWSVCLFSKV